MASTLAAITVISASHMKPTEVKVMANKDDQSKNSIVSTSRNPRAGWISTKSSTRTTTVILLPVRQRSSKARTIFCKSCVLVSGAIEKSCKYSLFRSCMDSCIFWNIFSSHFHTDFFQTKVYLFAQASSFVPSINTVSFDRVNLIQ